MVKPCEMPRPLTLTGITVRTETLHDNEITKEKENVKCCQSVTEQYKFTYLDRSTRSMKHAKITPKYKW